MKKEKCKARVPEPGSTIHFNQCKNKVTTDGYCWQHYQKEQKNDCLRENNDKWECWCCSSKKCKARKEEEWSSKIPQ